MDFWNHKVNVSEEAARRQVAIIRTFSPEKRFKIALDFAEMGIEQTRKWIKEKNPGYSEKEITLEFVRLMYYEAGEMPEEVWQFYRQKMMVKIRKDWARRFRAMMKGMNWTYDDVAQQGGFQSAATVKSTISRGLPSFAKVAVRLYEQMMQSANSSPHHPIPQKQ